MKIKKESPNEGTETRLYRIVIRNHIFFIKKESPNEGTETFHTYSILIYHFVT